MNNNDYLPRVSCLLLTLLLVFLIWPGLAIGSEESGTIGTSHAYAWSENFGWINFAISLGQVEVSDNGLTGHAWSENFGWINLAPPTAGVTNDSEGILGGHAWSENLGWINFTGVTINDEGVFAGEASVLLDDSRIRFNCTSDCGSYGFSVITDWRPVSTRTSPAGGSYAKPPPATPTLPEPPADFPLPPTCSKFADLNCDGQVNLRDFSILAFYWTG